jgi:ubiquinone/menaquinone biosynthesis C-methylase UbiE
MDEKKINEIFNQLEAGYDQMADKFSGTRKFFWRDLEFIADYVKKGDKILDFGCGNGRLLEILNDKKIDYTGADISGELIKLAKQKYKGKNVEFIKITSSDSLSFSDNYFNVAVSIAVFHHFPESYAQEMAKELYRILGMGGKIVVTVWNLEQERFQKFIKDKSKDLYIPFKDNSGEEFGRYHRKYNAEDLEYIFLSAGFKTKKCKIINGKNIFYLGEK